MDRLGPTNQSLQSLGYIAHELTPIVLHFFVPSCLCLRRHVGFANVSLRRNKPLCGVLCVSLFDGEMNE
jgi:hypothetical protein